MQAISSSPVLGAVPQSACEHSGARTTHAASALLEWIDLAGPAEAARLAVACFDATISETEGAAHIGLFGIDAIDRNLEAALRLWCDHAQRPAMTPQEVAA